MAKYGKTIAEYCQSIANYCKALPTNCQQKIDTTHYISVTYVKYCQFCQFCQGLLVFLENSSIVKVGIFRDRVEFFCNETHSAESNFAVSILSTLFYH